MTFLARKKAKRAGSSIAMAIALMTGAAVGVTALETPAYAQKKRDKEDKPSYSKGFIAAYTPVNEALNAEAKDEAAIRAGIPAMIAAIENDDDKNAAGGILNNIGVALDDRALMRQGINMMLESGKVAPERLGQFYYTAGQLAYNDDDFVVAREQLSKADAAGYTGMDLVPVIADTYFQQEQYGEGLAYMKGRIDAKLQAGETPPEDWLKRGVANAYNNDMAAEAVEFSAMYARHYPSETSWKDAINIQRNLFLYENPELLDLMRLADKTNTMVQLRDYVDYVDAANVLRFPGEVKRIIDRGVASGVVDPNETLIAETLRSANSRIAADKADLAGLERDAMASGASGSLVAGAGDAFLAYEMGDKAEAMYEIALTKPGADTARLNTRLGIAQLLQGKIAEAQETFAKVDGKRAPIARLWSVYAEVQGGGAAGTM